MGAPGIEIDCAGQRFSVGMTPLIGGTVAYRAEFEGGLLNGAVSMRLPVKAIRATPYLVLGSINKTPNDNEAGFLVDKGLARTARKNVSDIFIFGAWVNRASSNEPIRILSALNVRRPRSVLNINVWDAGAIGDNIKRLNEAPYVDHVQSGFFPRVFISYLDTKRHIESDCTINLGACGSDPGSYIGGKGSLCVAQSAKGDDCEYDRKECQSLFCGWDALANGAPRAAGYLAIAAAIFLMFIGRRFPIPIGVAIWLSALLGMGRVLDWSGV
jgi:hypothetical protein